MRSSDGAALPDAAAGETSPSSPGNPPWERVLYKRQPYPDWYFPSDRIATSVSKGPVGNASHTHLGITVAISPLIQNINVVFAFLHVFQSLEDGSLYPARLVFYSSVSLGLMAFAAWLAGRGRGKKSDRLQSDKSSPTVLSFIILLLLLYALSPVLKTLTEATTSDTIYPLAFMLFALHISLAENIMRRNATPLDRAPASAPASASAPAPAPTPPPPGQLFSALSLNAATSASLVLASRLPLNIHVFALMFSSILAFALFPAFTRRIIPPRQTALRVFFACVTVICAVVGSVAQQGIDATSTKVVFATNVFLFGIVPLWMRIASQRKTRYTGPWKIATPLLKSDARRRQSAL